MTERWLTIILMAVVLPACVTTSKGGFDTSVKKEDAVATRVEAAKKYLATGAFDRAKFHLEKAHKLDRKSADVHDALALVFHATGEHEFAENHYKKAVSFGKGQSRYRLNYASFLKERQNFVASAEQLEYIAEDALYEHRESALIMLGETQLQMLETEKARRSFERALGLNPNNMRILRELVVLTFEAGDYNDAWRYFQRYRIISANYRARSKAPSSAEMLLLGIHLADRLGKTDARQDYVRALKNEHPESREYQSYLRDTRKRN